MSACRDSQYLATGSSDGRLTVYQPEYSSEGTAAAAAAAAAIAAAGETKEWSFSQSKTPLFCKQVHTDWINSVCWLVPPLPVEPTDEPTDAAAVDEGAAGKKVWLVAGSSDRTISVW